MTLQSAYNELTKRLTDYSIENPRNEARFILESVLGADYSAFIMSLGEEISSENYQKAYEMISRRISGEPVQYILGKWDFLSLSFNVGEGVLIPRSETEILTEYICEKIKDIDSPVVYDLCSGSGCIGISIKKKVPSSKVFLVEKSQQALKYLRKNCEELCKGEDITVISGDILEFGTFGNLPPADVIVSNPPYIKSDEISLLQQEVQMEPRMALDGGDDGLMFYRVLVGEWTEKLKNDGFMAFECGEEQTLDIKALFNIINFKSEIINDYNNIARFVIGRRQADDI